jgi:glutathione S-transferase
LHQLEKSVRSAHSTRIPRLLTLSGSIFSDTWKPQRPEYLMISLLTYPPMFGQFSASPFCIKAAYLLTLSKVEWARKDVLDPRKMPYGKLPAILVDGKLIADSSAIQAHLESTGCDFDKGLSDMDKATSHAFIRMAEEHMYFVLLMDRWGNDQVWPSIRDTYFSAIPALMRGFISGRLRKEILSGMKTQGLGRFSEAERLKRVEPDLVAIAARLKESQFLFGDRPTAADCSLGAMLGAMIATPVKTGLSKRVDGDEVLKAYVARMEKLLS